ncbi:nhaP-type Na+/H+ and K+/H+ antiporters [Vibrio ishigakensis]|uniref:NhaP-type Na+/H+ and K+/H+ antiporters n=1 Tax=Vibrio ishigakensis TaxID=1481914 RepID=A0A0B8QHE5_9VIBR|nr:nhaP-type Na+/H+ and K+/H+ antiporters [Vibrio ishigakensis]
MINQGAEIKHTKLSENFTYEDYLKQYADTLIQPVFVVTAQERIHLVGDSTEFAPSEGETVVSLVKKVWSGEDRRGSR